MGGYIYYMEQVEAKTEKCGSDNYFDYTSSVFPVYNENKLVCTPYVKLEMIFEVASSLS